MVQQFTVLSFCNSRRENLIQYYEGKCKYFIATFFISFSKREIDLEVCIRKIYLIGELTSEWVHIRAAVELTPGRALPWCSTPG